MSEHFAENRLPEPEPEFPHAWTFSTQRYVPRPRPVARIILPSHSRVNDSVLPESDSLSAVTSPSDSLQPLLRLTRSGNGTRPRQGTCITKLFTFYKHLSNAIRAMLKKTWNGIVAAWSLVRKDSQAS